MATIKEEQIRALPGWQARGDGISRTFRFDDFGVATRFVGRIALDAAVACREPLIGIRGGRVTVTFVPRRRHSDPRRRGRGPAHPAAPRRPPPPGRPGRSLEPPRPAHRHPPASSGAGRPVRHNCGTCQPGGVRETHTPDLTNSSDVLVNPAQVTLC